MSDEYIKKEDAIVAYANHEVDVRQGKFDDYYQYMRNVLRSVESVDAVPRWIPCEERLPREKEVVLITNSEGNVRCGQFRGTSGKRLFWIGNTLEMVEAWMPLPEPYEGERKDDD